MSRCYECAEIEGFCTCIEKRIREQIAKEIEDEQKWIDETGAKVMFYERVVSIIKGQK